jgi:hypothetical protein
LLAHYSTQDISKDKPKIQWWGKFKKLEIGGLYSTKQEDEKCVKAKNLI